jgi:hypothetical protein
VTAELPLRKIGRTHGGGVDRLDRPELPAVREDHEDHGDAAETIEDLDAAARRFGYRLGHPQTLTCATIFGRRPSASNDAYPPVSPASLRDIR